jgi:AraC-like DNA-binding protein
MTALPTAYAPLQPALRTGDGHPIVYRETAPPPSLADDVACFWSLRSRRRLSQPFTYHVVPDACVDVVFACETGGAWIYGAEDRPFTVALHGHVALFGIRIRPGRFPGLLGPSGEELTRTVARVDDVLGARVARRLGAAIESAGDDDRQAAVASDTLQHVRRAPRPDLGVAIADAIATHAGRVRIASLATRLGVSPRQVSRACARTVGLPPKRLSRIVRFQTVLAQLTGAEGAVLADVAVAGGYYDQAHLTNEMTALCGMSPGSLRR